MLPILPAVPSSKDYTRHGPTTSLGFRPVYYSRTLSRLTRQTPPYNKPTTLTVSLDQVLSGRAASEGAYISINDGSTPSESLWRHAYNKAYQRLQDDINSSSSQLGSTIGEARKTADTLTRRAEWLYRFTRDKLKKRYFRAKDPSTLFIEYRWVYEATARDLYNAVDFLQNFEPKVRVSGSATVSDDSSRSMVLPPSAYPGRFWRRERETGRAKLTSFCKITNPNLFWAQQMGLTNPIAIGWELTKFSWLADWFGTLGEVLNSWDDRLGLGFEDPCLVIHREVMTDWIRNEWSNPDRKYLYSAASVKRTRITRDPTLGPGPFLMFRQIKGPSLVRGATAIALLSQLMGRH